MASSTIPQELCSVLWGVGGKVPLLVALSTVLHVENDQGLLIASGRFSCEVLCRPLRPPEVPRSKCCIHPSIHILHPIHTRIHPVPIPTILPYRKTRFLEVPEQSAASSCRGRSPFFAAAGTLIGCCSLPMTDADPRQRDTILEQRCDHTQVYSYRERILCRTADVLKTVPIIVENRSLQMKNQKKRNQCKRRK
ncbi:unnamed protein product, partial [Nesidiocoris tenuis]